MTNVLFSVLSVSTHLLTYSTVPYRTSQGSEQVDILSKLVTSLSECGFLTDHLAMPHTSCIDELPVSYEGDTVSRNRSRWRGADEKKRAHTGSGAAESAVDPDPETLGSGR